MNISLVTWLKNTKLFLTATAQALTLADKVQAKTNLDLQNVDNTSDANKPVSTATLSALNLKQAKSTRYDPYTWAGKPAANSVAAGCRITITDFLEEVDFYSNGTRWLSVGHGPVTLAVDPTSSSVGSTTAETTLKTVNVPVDLLGPTGIIEVDTGWACNSGNTNSKTGRVRIGTTVAGTAVLAQNLNTATTQSASARTIVWAANSTAAQKATPNSFGSGNTTPAIVSTTVDTAAAFSIYLTGTKANSADTLSLEVCRIRIYPGA